MIRVKELHIQHFRGIPDLTIDFDTKNFGICGPNGTGKSGVVDAVEFCISGDVTRLTGQGSSELSVKQHAPHVDARTQPEKAKVTLTASIPSLNNKEISISRSVKTPRAPIIEPNDDDVKAVIAELETHPEFALSRREIVKYVITPAGQRSVDVQTLLRLDHLEDLRKSLTTFRNNRQNQAKTAEQAQKNTERDFQNWLKLDELDRRLVLEKINAQREILGLPAIAELQKDTSFKAGIDEDTEEGGPKQALSKAAALLDLEALLAATKSTEPDDLKESRSQTADALQKLKDDAEAFNLIRRQQLVTMGLALVDENACPLCDNEWNRDELREYLNQKLENAKEVGEQLATLKRNLAALATSLSQREQAVQKVIAHCNRLDPKIDPAVLETYCAQLQSLLGAIQAFSSDPATIGDTIVAVTLDWWQLAPEALSAVQVCNEAVKALPDLSKANHARDFLVVAQERYEKLLEASADEKLEVERNKIAGEILGKYNETREGVLEHIYDAVATDFSRYYQMLNPEDEQRFVGKLEQAPAKLSFNVDFYERGKFPPGAYHSEGHQDAMGLCLYLALMKHTLTDQFTFAVLDDVLMSVDAGHRRNVCRLLTTEFKDTQFIVTTHDPIWLRYMKTQRLISKSQMFAGWTVDTGPRIWDDRDVWVEIDTELDANNVSRAAALLREYLEYMAFVIADAIKASVEFKGDGNYTLNDLMPPSLKRWKALLLHGSEAALHWDQKEKRAEIEELRKSVKKLSVTSNAEQWAINPAVHFNEWQNFQADEFREVVNAFKTILETLCCDDCGALVYVTPRVGTPEECRCNCGSVSINLKK